MSVRHDYARQILCWRAELLGLGVRLDTAKHPDEVRQVVTAVKDLGVRVRRVCDELKIPTTGEEPLDRLVAKINERL